MCSPRFDLSSLYTWELLNFGPVQGHTCPWHPASTFMFCIHTWDFKSGAFAPWPWNEVGQLLGGEFMKRKILNSHFFGLNSHPSRVRFYADYTLRVCSFISSITSGGKFSSCALIDHRPHTCVLPRLGWKKGCEFNGKKGMNLKFSFIYLFSYCKNQIFDWSHDDGFVNSFMKPSDSLKLLKYRKLRILSISFLFSNTHIDGSLILNYFLNTLQPTNITKIKYLLHHHPPPPQTKTPTSNFPLALSS